MRPLIIAAWLCAAWPPIVFGSEKSEEKPEFGRIVKASLEFRHDFDRSHHYPHVLRVFLRLENVHDAAVTWVANSISGIEVELLDGEGKPAPMPPQAASVPSSDHPFFLPFGSRLDWLISHGGVAMTEDAKGKCAIVVGGKGWLIPKESLSEYSLRIRLRGAPWKSMRNEAPAKVLLDIPPTKIKLPKNSEVAASRKTPRRNF